MQGLHITPSVNESRTELLQWVNSSIPMVGPNGHAVPMVKKVEQCGNGLPYVLMLPDMLPIPYPPLQSPGRVKVPATHEFDAVCNIKLVQEALRRNGIPQPDVLADNSAKLIKGNFQANLQFLQWFRGLYLTLQENSIEPGQGRAFHSLPGSSGRESPAVTAEQRMSSSYSASQHPVPAAAVQAPPPPPPPAAPVTVQEPVVITKSPPSTPSITPQARASPGLMNSTSSLKNSINNNGAAVNATPKKHVVGTPGRATPKTPKTKRDSSARRVRSGTPSKTTRSSSVGAGKHSPGTPSLAKQTRNQAAPPPITHGSKVSTVKSTPPDGGIRGTGGSKLNSGSRALATPTRPRPGSNGPSHRGTTSTPRRAARPPSPAPTRPACDAPDTVKGRTPSAAQSVTAPVVKRVATPPMPLLESRSTQTAAAPPTPQTSSPTLPPPADKATQRVTLERQFYYDKLRMIESLVASTASKPLSGGDVAAIALARSVRDVLYATS